MAPTEKPHNGSYKPATESPVEGPLFCSYDPRELAGKPIGMFHCPDCGEMQLAGYPHLPPDDPDPLFCSTCGVILIPVEAITLDVGDGDELLCDKCLGLSN